MFKWFQNKVAAVAERTSPPDTPPKRFPPVPDWQPDFSQPLDEIAERTAFYSNGTKDFAVFAHGTVAVLPDGLTDSDATAMALEALRGVCHAHPDMNPLGMKDGNIVVHYRNDVASVALANVVNAHWPEIERNHLRALATDEVLMSRSGPNVFDDFGKKILFGRCYMFMDAQEPRVVSIHRKTA